jgi:hypothetical protein
MDKDNLIRLQHEQLDNHRDLVSSMKRLNAEKDELIVLLKDQANAYMAYIDMMENKDGH